MKFLTIRALGKALAPHYGGVNVGYKVIMRAVEDKGMPCIMDPLYGRPRFILEDVLKWIVKGRQGAADAIETEARRKAMGNMA